MTTKTAYKVWVGFADGEPYYYSFREYYEGVRHADFFKTRKEARRCYGDVRKAILIVEWQEKYS